jgi:hypothetical protein
VPEAARGEGFPCDFSRCACIPAGTPSQQEASVNKDTLTFAFILSVIDFFLCFVMIAGIGVVISLLRYLDRFGKLDENKMRL